MQSVVYLGGGGGWWGDLGARLGGLTVCRCPLIVTVFAAVFELTRLPVVIVREAACVAVLAPALEVEAAQPRPLPFLLGVQ